MGKLLPYVPGFVERLGEALKPGAEAFGSYLGGKIKRSMANEAYEKQSERYNKKYNSDQNSPLDGIIANASGQENTPQPGDSIGNPEPTFLERIEDASRLGKAAEAAGMGKASTYTDKLLNEHLQNKKVDRRAEHRRIEKSEPELLAKEQKLEHYEQEGMRFERLQNLFTPELEDKFPPSFAIGLFSKDGELRPTAAAVLSPEAQEAVKLVADNLSGAKDTFGARVTNFDLQAYMKRLPTLLNTSEGRRRVLRDLRLINKLNIDHEKGVLDIVERQGGPGKISLSQAERRYKKENAKQIADIREEFVSPQKKNFSSLQAIDPKVYSGNTVIDEETGQRFKSNGQEWIPEG